METQRDLFPIIFIIYFSFVLVSEQIAIEVYDESQYPSNDSSKLFWLLYACQHISVY